MQWVIRTPWLSDAFYALERWRDPWAQRYSTLKGSGPIPTYFSPSLAVNATNICNSRCVFCAYPKAKTVKGVMTMETFERTLKAWLGYRGASGMDFCATVGEPFLDRRLIPKIRLAREAGLRVSTTTNGTTLRNCAVELAETGIDTVFVSIGGFDAVTHQRAFGVDTFEEVYDGLLMLLQAKRHTTTVVIRVRNPDPPARMMAAPLFAEIKKRLGPTVLLEFTAYYDNWGGTIQQSDLAGSMQLRWKDGVEPARVCRHAMTASVLWDGAIRLCGCRMMENDRDELVVGHIKDSAPFALAMDKARVIYENFTRGVRAPVCQHCSLYRP